MPAGIKLSPPARESSDLPTSYRGSSRKLCSGRNFFRRRYINQERVFYGEFFFFEEDILFGVKPFLGKEHLSGRYFLLRRHYFRKKTVFSEDFFFGEETFRDGQFFWWEILFLEEKL